MRENVSYRRNRKTGTTEITIRFKYFAPRSQKIREVLVGWEFLNVCVIADKNIARLYMPDSSAIMFKLMYEEQIEECIGKLYDG